MEKRRVYFQVYARKGKSLATSFFEKSFEWPIDAIQNLPVSLPLLECPKHGKNPIGTVVEKIENGSSFRISLEVEGFDEEDLRDYLSDENWKERLIVSN